MVPSMKVHWYTIVTPIIWVSGDSSAAVEVFFLAWYMKITTHLEELELANKPDVLKTHRYTKVGRTAWSVDNIGEEWLPGRRSLEDVWSLSWKSLQKV